MESAPPQRARGKAFPPGTHPALLIPPQGLEPAQAFPFSFPPMLPSPRKEERPPLSWSLQCRSTVGGAVLVSVGSWSQNRQFLPLGTKKSSERSIIIISVAVVYGLPAVFSAWIKTLHTSLSPPGETHSSQEEMLFFVPFSIPRVHALKILFDRVTLIISL